MFRLKRIGTIHSPYKERHEAPTQGKDKTAEIEVCKEYEGD